MKFTTTIYISKSELREAVAPMTLKQKTDFINEIIFGTMPSSQIEKYFINLFTELKETEEKFDNRKGIIHAYEQIIKYYKLR